MVKSYLRYVPSATLGVIVSPNANIVAHAHAPPNSRHAVTLAIVPALEAIKIWNTKSSALLATLHDAPSMAEVTAVTLNPANPLVLAAGHHDGSIRLWTLNDDFSGGDLAVTFNGHKSAVTHLAFDEDGNRLVSGSRDTDMVLWDIVAETGLVRLRAHTDQITGLAFLPESQREDELRGRDLLVSAGKDGLVKVWDLTTAFCCETHVAHRGEVWALTVSPDRQTVVTAGPDGEVKLWRFMSRAEDEEGKVLVQRGVVTRSGKEQPLTMRFHPAGSYLAIRGSSRNVEVLRIRSAEEINKQLSRKRKRKAKKGDVGEDTTEENEVGDEIVAYTTIRATSKVRSIDWEPSPTTANLLLSLDSNSLALYAIPPPKKSVEPTPTLTTTLSLPGHPTEIRTLAVSSDNEMLLSAGPGQAKVWNVRTGNIIRSWSCGFALCSAFLPGDKIVVLGTKEGELELFDLPSSEAVDVVKAHEGTLWSLQVASDGMGMVSGSSDKSVKFWNVQVVAEQAPDSESMVSKLRLQHTRTLKLNEDVLSVVLTPDSNLLCVALLDRTIKIFFTKTLKHHLTLYGHASPATNLSISLDSKLLLSVSQDRTAKLWGLDFGDLHRSVRAHSAAVMAGMFERGTDERDWRNFWTVGRDGGVRYWDGNTWERILEVKKDGAEIWAVEGDSRGDWVVVAGRDKAIRIWERSEEQVFLEEEREKEVEANYEEDLVEGLERTRVDDEGGEGEVVQAGKATVETLNAGERIIEALELSREDREMVLEYARGKKAAPLMRNPIFMAYGGVSAERYVLSVLEKVKPTALQDALLILPFEHVEILITFIAQWAQSVQSQYPEAKHPSSGWNIKLTALLLTSLIRVHHGQIVASRTLRPTLDILRKSLRASLARERELTGWNCAGLGYLKRELVENGIVGFEPEQPLEKGEKKRAFPAVA